MELLLAENLRDFAPAGSVLAVSAVDLEITNVTKTGGNRSRLRCGEFVLVREREWLS